MTDKYYTIKDNSDGDISYVNFHSEREEINLEKVINYSNVRLIEITQEEFDEKKSSTRKT